MHKILAKTLFVGQKIHFVPECQSTNDMAADLLKNESVVEGAMVVTDKQTNGRGQRGNTWESSAGKNLTLSIILKPKFLTPRDHFQLHYITSLAVCTTLLRYFRDVKIKWPNDLLIKGKKICGILIENNIRGRSIENSIVGIGLNVNQSSFDYALATSFVDLSGQDYSREEILTILLEQIESKYLMLKAGRLEELKKEYLRHLFRIGDSALYEAAGVQFTGTIQGVDEEGRLIIATANDVRYFEFKEVKFIY
ncbi:MAG: biotin--[acetyl-CoA-carboxylase] ligase [Bacteroidota bacterium]